MHSCSCCFVFCFWFSWFLLSPTNSVASRRATAHSSGRRLWRIKGIKETQWHHKQILNFHQEAQEDVMIIWCSLLFMLVILFCCIRVFGFLYFLNFQQRSWFQNAQRHRRLSLMKGRGHTKNYNIKDIAFSIKKSKTNAMSIWHSWLHVVMSLVFLVVFFDFFAFPNSRPIPLLQNWQQRIPSVAVYQRSTGSSTPKKVKYWNYSENIIFDQETQGHVIVVWCCWLLIHLFCLFMCFLCYCFFASFCLFAIHLMCSARATIPVVAVYEGLNKST